jgi:ferredoxin-NADP reductase
MSSLGNVEVTPLASLTFINFVTGDILYITGRARTLIGTEAEALMRRQKVLTTVTTTGYTFVRDALPLRQDPNIPVVMSPYSPPVKFLVEETPSASNHFFENTHVLLTGVDLLSQDLAVFRFEIQGPAVEISPGQSIALDFTDFVGPQQYAHMNPWKPTSLNDDRIRTWTVSSAHVAGKTQTFELTMREKPGGLITGALFTVARKLKESMPHLMADCKALGMSVRLVGVAGEFVLPPIQDSAARKKLLFVAGGIGVTPFLSMLKAIRERGEERDVVLLLSTKEPKVLLDLLVQAIYPPSLALKLVVHVFSSQEIPDLGTSSAELKRHSSRISQGFWTNGLEDANEREVYLCGPPEFNKAILEQSGLEADRVRSEGFNY